MYLSSDPADARPGIMHSGSGNALRISGPHTAGGQGPGDTTCLVLIQEIEILTVQTATGSGCEKF